MKPVFVDTSHIIASLDPHDALHEKAVVLDDQFRDSSLVTSDFIINEVLNYFCEFGPIVKRGAVTAIETLYAEGSLTIIECSHSLLLDGIELYESRLDKGYSLTDCISMNLMRELGADQILSSDKHFQQEGFIKLL